MGGESLKKHISSPVFFLFFFFSLNSSCPPPSAATAVLAEEAVKCRRTCRILFTTTTASFTSTAGRRILVSVDSSGAGIRIASGTSRCARTLFLSADPSVVSPSLSSRRIRAATAQRPSADAGHGVIVRLVRGRAATKWRECASPCHRKHGTSCRASSFLGSSAPRLWRPPLSFLSICPFAGVVWKPAGCLGARTCAGAGAPVEHGE